MLLKLNPQVEKQMELASTEVDTAHALKAGLLLTDHFC